MNGSDADFQSQWKNGQVVVLEGLPEPVPGDKREFELPLSSAASGAEHAGHSRGDSVIRR